MIGVERNVQVTIQWLLIRQGDKLGCIYMVNANDHIQKSDLFLRNVSSKFDCWSQVIKSVEKTVKLE